MTLTLAKEAILNLSPNELMDMGRGYSGSWLEVDYADVPQRWLLVRSEQATNDITVTT